jgi:ketosteroid isomerase-like protein
MPNAADPLASDDRFFAALLAADSKMLGALLAEDFVIIDVMAGSEVPRDAFLGAVQGGQLVFESIEPAERRVRRRPGTAIVTGRTLMKGRFGETPFTARSRYTHVFVEQAGAWRLVAAQGTQIAAAPQPG